jgi:hypothetical protein
MVNNRSIEKLSSPKSHIRYTIIKKDVDKNYYPDLPSNYGNTSQELYLGLIENKNKVVKEKLHIDYIAGAVSLDNNTTSLKRSFEDEDGELSSPPKRTKVDQHSSRLDELDGKTSTDVTENKPPSIADIKQKYAAIDQKNNDDKRKMLAKFSLMKEMYPTAVLPYMNMSTELEYMKNEYEILMRRLRIHDKTVQYKQFLAFAFYGIEFILGKFAKMNMEGFAKSQIANLTQYDRLLIELGHKHYVADAPETFPVEIRLIGMILINTAIFIVMQKVTASISGSSFSNLTNMLSTFMGGVNNSNQVNFSPVSSEQTKQRESNARESNARESNARESNARESNATSSEPKPKMQGPKVYETPKPAVVKLESENKEKTAEQ